MQDFIAFSPDPFDPKTLTPAAVRLAAVSLHSSPSSAPMAFGGDWNEWVYKGLAVLLIGCPCALVISTPAAFAASLSAGARRGMLIKGGAVPEQLGEITVAAFDKACTLTEGKPKVTDIIGAERCEADMLKLAADLETGSSHPLATATFAEAMARGVALAAGALALPSVFVLGNALRLTSFALV